MNGILSKLTEEQKNVLSCFKVYLDQDIIEIIKLVRNSFYIY
ncbi:hypothetical protein [Rickettsia oklahomensis]|uniref:Uncharacterized protein n=1 Tax=Rickettsia oklahomensis TaxID=3141789 RepID=A0AAU7BZ05_9RICK